MVTIDFVVKRHGAKSKPNVPIVSSTPEDCVLPLSDKSMKEERTWGEKHIQPPPYYAHVIGISSDYLRTVQTLDFNLLGAGYDPRNGQKVTTMVRSDIGLGVNNHDRSAHPEMPLYGHEKEVLDAYVRTLFEKFWHPRKEGNPPCLAAYAAAMLDAIAYGIERAQGLPLPDDARVLVEIVTHCPVIDAGAYAVKRVLNLSPENAAIAMLSEERWTIPENWSLAPRSAFQTGESFSGQYVSNWKTIGPYPTALLDDPIAFDNLSFDIKGEEFAFHWENDAYPPVDCPEVVRALRSARQHYLEEASTLHE